MKNITHKMGLDNMSTKMLHPKTCSPEQFHNAVVFYAEVDYHIRNFSAICRALGEAEIKSIIVDVSMSPCFKHQRPLGEDEFDRYKHVEIVQYPYSGEEKLPLVGLCYVFPLDWGHSRSFIKKLKRKGIPTVGFYEGISDDYNVKTPRLYLPYRLMDYLLVPGDYYRSIYKKQKIFVVGLPVVQSLLIKKSVFPAKPLALININFSYGTLDSKRKMFLQTAVEACRKVGIEYLINQHPADTASLSAYSVSEASIYEDLERSTVLISRFSTCILEALAMGKPVVYHNPHNERFDKFMSDPMGAYDITRTVKELSDSICRILKEIEIGVDFRSQSKAFLQYHANIFSATPCCDLAAQAIQKIVLENTAEYNARPMRLSLSVNERACTEFLSEFIPLSRIKWIVREFVGVSLKIYKDPFSFPRYWYKLKDLFLRNRKDKSK